MTTRAYHEQSHGAIHVCWDVLSAMELQGFLPMPSTQQYPILP